MVTVELVENTLYDWAYAVLNPTGTLPGAIIPVIWFHENMPRPTKPYLAIHLSTINSKGVDYVGIPNNSGIAEIVGNRDLSLLIQGFGENSMNWMEKLKTSLEKPSIQLILRVANLVFVERLGINCIAEVVDNRFEERNQMDLRFRFAQIDSDNTGLIEHANVTGTLKGPDLNTITVTHINI
jgi:hypothetical protein